MTGDLHGKVVTFCHHLILQSRISCWWYFRICSCPSSKVSMVDQVLTFHRILVWIPQPQRSSILEHIASVKSWGDHRSRTCRCSRWHGSLISKQPTSSMLPFDTLRSSIHHHRCRLKCQSSYESICSTSINLFHSFNTPIPPPNFALMRAPLASHTTITPPVLLPFLSQFTHPPIPSYNPPFTPSSPILDKTYRYFLSNPTSTIPPPPPPPHPAQIYSSMSKHSEFKYR